jgi:UDP-N-acetylmuramoyl-tripeptide--D-alanyl-D-alanine ligase
MLKSLYKKFQDHPHITTDSRKITEGCIFFALKGESFDGNSFAEKAIEQGAAYAVIDNPVFKKNRQYILVKDVLKTLQKLATYHRRQFEFPLIVIAGSNGKTTTKELVSAVMSTHYNTHFTRGNLNNHIGVPLTLLQLNEEHDVAVIEIGANHQGENHLLCDITEPTHGIVTNMGKDHLEGFGGFEGSKKANAEVYKWLAKHNGTIFINDDEMYLKDWLPTEGGHKIYYRREENPSMQHFEYETALISANPYLEVGFLDEKGGMVKTLSHLVGEYNFANIITAIAIGKYFKVPARKIKEAIENYIPSMNRSQIVQHESGATLLLDAYNANPSSMAAALKTLSQMPQKNKIAIIGDMRELGDESAAEHKYIFEMAKTLNFNELVTVGQEFKMLNTEGVSFLSSEEARDWFKNQKFDTDTCILFKASRGIGLEKILA